MSFIHDCIKIKYVKLGYLPDYPYHMISDSEMYDAFISETSSDKPLYFDDIYPCNFEELQDKYDALRQEILAIIATAKTVNEYVCPNWVYSYMLGQVISPMSPQIDKHDMFVLMGKDNISDEFTVPIHLECYKLSKQAILLGSPNSAVVSRSAPSIFGEPDVIKRLRVAQLGGLGGSN